MMAVARCVARGVLSTPCILRHHICRQCSSHHSPPDKVAPPGFLKRYLVDKVVHYVNKSSGVLERTYPKVFQIFRTFKTGMSSFVSDSMTYYSVTTSLWSGACLSEFSRRQLEIYREMPGEMVRVSPMLLIAAIPGGSGIFPLAYAFPKYLLSQHFLTQQQKADFGRDELQKRLKHFKNVLDALWQRSRHIDDSPAKTTLIKIIGKLERDERVEVEEVMEIAILFQAYPYHVDAISIAYVRHLAKAMKMSLSRKRLYQDAVLLYYTDLAMLKEGLESMDIESLDKACFWRGLNPVGLSREEKEFHLRQWTTISAAITEDNVSLLLHAPLFLFSSLPNNRNLWYAEILAKEGKIPTSISYRPMSSTASSSGPDLKTSASDSSRDPQATSKQAGDGVTAESSMSGGGGGRSKGIVSKMRQALSGRQKVHSSPSVGKERSFSSDCLRGEVSLRGDESFGAAGRNECSRTSECPQHVEKSCADLDMTDFAKGAEDVDGCDPSFQTDR